MFKKGLEHLLKRGHMGQKSVTSLHVGGYLVGLMEEQRVTTDQLAKATGLSQNLITCLLTGKQVLTGDVAFILSDFFGMSPLFWLDLQRNYYLADQNIEKVGVRVAA